MRKYTRYENEIMDIIAEDMGNCGNIKTNFFHNKNSYTINDSVRSEKIKNLIENHRTCFVIDFAYDENITVAWK